MKKIISLCLLMAYGCLSVMATQDAKEYKTYVKDNHRVYYCTSQGISIVVDPSPRGLFEPHITIINDSGHDFVFEPKEIRAYAYAAPGNTYKETRYRVERFLEKGGDASLLEQDPLDIYTPEKYMRKTNSAFWWGNILTETIVAGVEAIGPQDADTRYLNEISREKALTAVRWDEYVRFSKLPEQDRRLEFWAWNIIADKDLIINPRYHRLELYGTTAFCPTGTNALMVYTRPMSATKAMKYDEKLYRDSNNGVIDYSVKLEDFKVNAFVDDKEVKILSIQNMTEQYGNQKMGAFLMMLDYTVHHDDTTIHQIRITAENTKHHEKGENICYYQSPDFE